MSTELSLPLDIRLMRWATHALWVAGAALFLVFGMRWALVHPVWAVERISVHGDVAHQNPVTLRAHLALQRGEPLSASFLTTDLQRWSALFESAPWVQKAVVQREFPSGLKVTLVEHRAVAWWGQVGSGQLINSSGQIFDASYEGSDELPELYGPREQAQAVWQLFGQLQTQLSVLDLSLKRLETNERGGWRAQLDSGAWIELGRGGSADVLARTQRFATTLTQVTQRYTASLASMDLRYPNGYAVRLRGVATLDDSLNPVSPR